MRALDESPSFFAKLLRQGGPCEADYDEFEQHLIVAYSSCQHRQPSSDEPTESLRASLGEALSPSTMQGFARCKPNGYAGCFEMIDRIYTEYHSPDPALAAWDRYFQTRAAPQAVRNRKSYFVDWLSIRIRARGPQSLLNLASGPGRDLSEALAQLEQNQCEVVCVDQDERAISYASTLCKPWAESIQFQCANALRYRPDRQFDLVWSSGLFDYLPDRLFIRLLSRMRGWVISGGEVVVGNFSPSNPTRPYMEVVLDWVLIHRTPDDLLRLAAEAGFGSSSLRIGSEPLGVNLFLHATVK